MMKNKILARLQDGDSVDEIAKEFSDALNAAEAEFNSASKDAEHKRYLVLKMAEPLQEYVETYFGDNEELVKNFADFGSKDEDLDEVAEVLDFILPLMDTKKVKIKTHCFNDIYDIFSPFSSFFSKNSKM